MLKVGNFFFRWRDTAFSLIFAFAMYLVTRPEMGLGNTREEWIITGAGLFIAACGQFVRAFTIGFAYIKRGGLKKEIYAETLVHRGMFAHSRNPMYLGNLMIVTGAIITINIIYYYIIALPLFYFIYLSITVSEEEYLSKKFGAEYQTYLKEVNRFIPGNLGKFKKSTEGMSFTWKRLIKKEHGSFVVVFAGLCLCILLKFHFRHNVSWDSCMAITLYSSMGALLLFQIVSAILKRTGRLEPKPENL